MIKRIKLIWSTFFANVEKNKIRDAGLYDEGFHAAEKLASAKIKRIESQRDKDRSKYSDYKAFLKSDFDAAMQRIERVDNEIFDLLRTVTLFASRNKFKFFRMDAEAEMTMQNAGKIRQAIREVLEAESRAGELLEKLEETRSEFKRIRNMNINKSLD